MRQKSLLVWALFLALMILPVHIARASSDINLCDSAAARAAQSGFVPVSVLMSIARVESGRAISGTFAPWPWTLNVQGKGHFFASKSEAVAFANVLLAQNIINFDVGCFQINLRWHARNFSSIEHAFAPEANAAYAAHFLSELYQEHGNWPKAVATYHSRTQKHAQVYLQKVKSTWQNLQNGQSTQPQGARAQGHILERGVNQYPLLQPAYEDAVTGASNGGLLPRAATPRLSPILP